MEGRRYDAHEDWMGNITLTDTETGKRLFMQGDDASQFASDWEAIATIWNTGGVTIFEDYAEHFDRMASEYDDVMEDDLDD
jgi:hypothetical protein